MELNFSRSSSWCVELSESSLSLPAADDQYGGGDVFFLPPPQKNFGEFSFPLWAIPVSDWGLGRPVPMRSDWSRSENKAGEMHQELKLEWPPNPQHQKRLVCLNASLYMLFDLGKGFPPHRQQLFEHQIRAPWCSFRSLFTPPQPYTHIPCCCVLIKGPRCVQGPLSLCDVHYGVGKKIPQQTLLLVWGLTGVLLKAAATPVMRSGTAYVWPFVFGRRAVSQQFFKIFFFYYWTCMSSALDAAAGGSMATVFFCFMVTLSAVGHRIESHSFIVFLELLNASHVETRWRSLHTWAAPAVLKAKSQTEECSLSSSPQPFELWPPRYDPVIMQPISSCSLRLNTRAQRLFYLLYFWGGSRNSRVQLESRTTPGS